jgi:FAD synthase
VHLGHQKILSATVERARAAGRPGVAITFEPHPLKVLHPELAPKMIQTLPQRGRSSSGSASTRCSSFPSRATSP